MEENKKIVFVYPIFCPDEIRFQEGINSLTSFLEYNKISEVDIIVGGWTAKEEYWDAIVKLTENKVTKIQRFDKNYGKAYIVNNLVNPYLEENPECEYFLSCDSDICLEPNQGDIFARLVNAAEHVNGASNGKFSYFALEQTGVCCHEHFRFDRELQGNGEVMTFSSSGSGIAGGAIFVKVEFWKKVGGYRVMGVYSGDDGFLLNDSNRNGYIASVIKTVRVFHPGNSTEEYTKWKHAQLNVCRGVVTNDLEADIKKADEYWKTK